MHRVVAYLTNHSGKVVHLQEEPLRALDGRVGCPQHGQQTRAWGTKTPPYL